MTSQTPRLPAKEPPAEGRSFEYRRFYTAFAPNRARARADRRGWLSRLFGSPARLPARGREVYPDLATKEMLLDSLKHFDGTMLFVSHDREFLRGLSNRVLELGGESGTEAQPHVYPGSYIEYVERTGHEAPGSTGEVNRHWELARFPPCRCGFPGLHRHPTVPETVLDERCGGMLFNHVVQ